MGQRELNDVQYLRALAERIFRIPVVHGTDQYDTDRLYRIAQDLEGAKMNRRGKSTWSSQMYNWAFFERYVAQAFLGDHCKHVAEYYADRFLTFASGRVKADKNIMSKMYGTPGK